MIIYYYLLHWICVDQILEICKNNSVNPLYLIIGKVNEYFEKINRNKYFMLVLSIENQEIMKKYEELWSKIRDLIRSVTKNLLKNSDDYNKKIFVNQI